MQSISKYDIVLKGQFYNLHTDCAIITVNVLINCQLR